MAEPGYKVELDAFSGPLDLLLHLVRRHEVPVEELPVALVTEQYLAYMARLEHIDVEQASEYLVMAAQLLQLKARALLPEEVELDDGGEHELLTRDDLIRGLLAYRRLAEEVRLLEGVAALARHRHGRLSARRVEERPLSHVDVWDLLTAYRRLEHQLGAGEAAATVVEADRQPLYEHIRRLRELLASAREGLRFQDLVTAGAARGTLVATFLALLELVRLHEVRLCQEQPFGEVGVAQTSAEEREGLEARDVLAEGERLDPGRGPTSNREDPCV